MEDVAVVILSAGMGKRMGGEVPKPLIEIAGRPMLGHLHSSVLSAGLKPITVISKRAEEIFKEKFPNKPYRIQEIQAGTADALLVAKDACGRVKRVMVLYGDHPFVSQKTIKKLLKKSEETGAEITLASTEVPNFENQYKVFFNFAKILRKDGKITGIREYKDASEKEREIKETNPGYYVFKSEWLWPNLEKIENQNAQGEKYLTDLVHMAKAQGMKIENIKIEPREALGVNTKEELEIAKNWQDSLPSVI